MIGLIDLIPAPYRLAAKLIVVALVLAAAFGAGVALTADHYQPRLALERSRADEALAAYQHLAGVTQEQNAAVNALKAEAERRAQQSARDLALAQAVADYYRNKATEIAQQQPPPGVDLCTAAQAAFEADLAAERGNHAKP